MGQFSWITKRGEQIRNEHHQGQQVWMIFKKDGNVKIAHETEYEGYGVFGGIDYYAALYEMNFDKILNHKYVVDIERQRNLGIDLSYTDISVNGKIEYPQLFTYLPCNKEIEDIYWLTECPNDPHQGWIVEDEDY
jgi:hypothetical protein